MKDKLKDKSINLEETYGRCIYLPRDEEFTRYK
jgi:hypothetical protein